MSDDVNYRSVPGPFAGLSPSERRVVWSLVRISATTAWWVAACLSLAWLIVSGMQHAYRPVQALVPMAAAVAAGVLEYHAAVLQVRDEQPPR